MKASCLVIDEIKLKSHWVTIEKVVEYTGYAVVPVVWTVTGEE